MKQLILLALLIASPLAAQKLTDDDAQLIEQADRIMGEVAQLDALIADPAKAREFFEARKAVLQDRLLDTEIKLLRKNEKSPRTDRVDWTAREIKKAQ